MIFQELITIETPGRGIRPISEEVANLVAKAGFDMGLCQLFIQHTSASLILCENYDPLVRRDLETFMLRLIPDGDPVFQHNDEGPDDMPAHIRTILTHSSLTIPISKGQLGLGTWQGIYLWEHRYAAQTRKVIVTLFS